MEKAREDDGLGRGYGWERPGSSQVTSAIVATGAASTAVIRMRRFA